jgi:beta-glucosidase
MKHADVIAKLSLREKCALLSGATVFETHALPNKGVPAIWLSDGPNGLRKQAGPADHLGLNPSEPATCFPTAATVANSWDPALGEEIGKALGEETASYSVNVILGPGLNTKRSPLCGRDFEYFSEDPYLSGKLAAGYVRGIQSVGVSACPKHFAANNQELRRMASNSVLDERTLRELYLTGFEIAVKEGRPKCIMTSYNRVNGTYANENHHLLQDILHGEWGYDGAVVTDWGGSNDHVEGVREGSTLEMPCPGFGSAKRLMQAVAEGRLPESAVDARVDELLELVFTTDAAVKAAPKRFDRDAHHALARRAAAESVVLLKNEDDLLPLKPGQSVALIGDFAQTPRYQGAGSSSVNATRVDNLKDAAEADDITLAGFCAGYERSGTPNPAFVEEAAALARKADVAVLCMGLDESSESEGLDRSHICIPENQKQLLEAVAQANENLVVVLSAGSVVETGWVSRCKAVLHAYLGGQAGAGAIMDVLTGRVNPSGKLAETLPLTYEDTPAARYFPGKQQNVEYREGLYIGYRYYETAHVPVRYPFGYGLSYTTFAYSDLKADADKVTFTITNTGSRAGAEIAQLYVAKADAAVFRPEKELKGFAKVFLQAGECKTVTIPLDDKAFRYWNVKTDRWETEGGSYQLLVGASVQDIRLRAEVSVQGTGAPDPYAGKAVQCYRTADIKNVPDAAFEALLCHAIPEDKPHIDQTMTLGELNHSRSPLCWLAWAVLHTLLKRSSREGTPDLNLLFQYNMPVRALAQMTGGMVGQETVDGIVMEAKGFWIIGLLRALIGFGQNAVSNRKFRAALDAERGGPAV